MRAVEESKGIVLIGLKEPLQPSTRASGRFQAMARARVEDLQRLLADEGVAVLQSMRYTSTVVARIDAIQAPRLRRLPIVNFLEVPASGAPGQAAQIVDTAQRIYGLPGVWTMGGGAGGSATITILDSGLDSLHYYLPTGDGPASLSVCGYVSSARSCYNPADVHGSAVAGVVAGRDNCCGIVGVAYGPLTVNFARITDSVQYWGEAAFIAALDWATSLQVPRHIVNMSFQFCTMGSASWNAIGRASQAGILLVSIAGNTNWLCSGFPPGANGVTFPGRYPEVLAVAGTSVADGFALPEGSCSGSRQGPEVALSAPFKVQTMGFAGSRAVMCGTSFSAPAVSGAAALVWTQNPSWNATAVRSRLFSSALDLGPTGRDQQFGFGRLSAVNALQSPLQVSLSGPGLLDVPGTYTWSATASGSQAPYSIVWSYRSSATGAWVAVGSGSTHSRNVTASSPSFQLLAQVTTPAWQGSASATTAVTVSMGGGCNPYCE